MTRKEIIQSIAHKHVLKMVKEYYHDFKLSDSEIEMKEEYKCYLNIFLSGMYTAIENLKLISEVR